MDGGHRAPDITEPPDASGLVRVAGDVRGGHEFVLDELDVPRQLVWFTNSWSESWGVSGRACIGWDDFGRLLSEEGDVTAFTPVTAPAPTPSPTPGDDAGAELAGCLSKLLPIASRWLKSRGN